MKIGTFSPGSQAFSVSYGPLFIKLQWHLGLNHCPELLSFLRAPPLVGEAARCFLQFRNRFFSRFFLFRIYTGSWQLRTKPDNEPLSRLTLDGLVPKHSFRAAETLNQLWQGRVCLATRKETWLSICHMDSWHCRGQQTWRGWAPCLAWESPDRFCLVGELLRRKESVLLFLSNIGYLYPGR